MAKVYQISTWASDTSMHATHYQTNFRIDAALDALWDQIQAMVQKHGDEFSMRRIRRAYLDFDAACSRIHPLADKHYFSKDFVLSTDYAGKLHHVRFVAMQK